MSIRQKTYRLRGIITTALLIALTACGHDSEPSGENIAETETAGRNGIHNAQLTVRRDAQSKLEALCQSAPLIVTRKDDDSIVDLDLGLSLRQATGCPLGERPRRQIIIDDSVTQIKLRSPIHLFSNTHIEGGEARPLVRYQGGGSVFYVDDRSDVRLTGLSITQGTGASNQSGDCISVRGNGQDILLENLHVYACNDGLIDITASRKTDRLSVTVRDSLLSDHDKAILISGPSVDAELCSNPASINVYLERLTFLRTGQRHPRVAGSVDVKLRDSIVSHEPFLRPDGSYGASYGVIASQGARVSVERTVFNATNLRGRKIAVERLVNDTHPCTELIYDAEGRPTGSAETGDIH